MHHAIVAAAFAVGVFFSGVHTGTEQKEFGFPHTKRLGKATVQFRDSRLQVVLNYEYSQRSHNSAWLLVDFGARAEKRLVLDREHFKLVSETGEWFPVASQRHFLDSAPQIQSLRQNAAVWRRGLGSYFGALDYRDQLKFFALPGEGVIITGAGEYALLIEHPLAR